jgi:NAD(P)-dependent dehydrogenase (short-subunit alcohol dehydrogenase family)
MGSNYVIIGGSSDIAKCVIDELKRSGSEVTTLIRNNEDLETWDYSGIEVVIGDATSQEDILKCIEKAGEKGDIDAVAHCVGSVLIRPPHALKKPDFEEVIATNLTSAFLTLSLAGKKMLKQKHGRIIFTSSVAASLGLVNHEAIAAAKGGIEAMARSAAATYAKRGIRINVVAPGLTDTKMTSSMITNPASREVAESKIPIGRINQKEEAGGTIAWLMKDAPDNLTGQVIHLDGGMSEVLC